MALRLARLVLLFARRVLADNVFMTAAALSYKTLLGLIPILVVVTLVAKTVMGEKFAPFVAGFIESLGLDQMQITPPPGPDAADAATAGSAPAAAIAPQGTVALGTWVEDLVTKASEIDLSALGSVGVLVTVASAIWLMGGIEESFNRIYRARQGRAWVRRVVLYWFVLTASPLLLAAIPLLAGALNDLRTTPALSALVGLIKAVWDLGVMWVLLMVVYVVVPAARVRLRSAAAGALVASICILALKWFLSAYFARAFGISRLYGSLGLIPVFMFWMYFVWLMVLLGLEVTALAQTVHTRGLDAGNDNGDERFNDPAMLLAAMQCACGDWAEGQPPTRERIATALAIDDRLATELLEALVRAGFLQHTDGDAYVPARPPEAIHADEVLRTGFSLCAGSAGVERASLACEVRRAQLEAASRMPLSARPR